MVAWLLGAGAIASAVAVAVHAHRASSSASPASFATEAPHGVVGTLKTTNPIGRSGAFFLPPGYESAQLPLLVALHGTDGSGAGMVTALRGAAEKRKFIIVAPDSRRAPNGRLSWEVPSRPGETSGDTAHIRGCLDEVLAMPGVQVDRMRTLVVGHSGGGSTAAYEASVDPFYKAFAVLHGGVLVNGLGHNAVRGWFSTGTVDSMRTPASVRQAAEMARRAGLGPVEYREFAEGHDMGPEEIQALMEWWLGN